jgi:hypothetical protein
MTETKKSGRKPFEPAEALRRQVQTLAAFGVPQEDICRMAINPNTKKPIDIKTLRKYFRQELDVGASKATAKVVESLFRQAVGAPAQYDARGRVIRAERAPVLAAAVFWMKTHAKLRETANPERRKEHATLKIDKLDRDV